MGKEYIISASESGDGVNNVLFFMNGTMASPKVSRVGESLGAGALNIIEGTIDTVATGVGFVHDIFGADEAAREIKSIIEEDLINERAVAKTILDPFGIVNTEDTSVLGGESEGLLESGGISFGGATLDDALTKKIATGIANK